MPTADKRQRKKENARQARAAREAAEKRKRQLKGARNIGIVVGLFVIIIVIVTVVGNNGKKKASSTSTTPSTLSTPTTVKYPRNCLSESPKKQTKPTYKAPPAMTIDPSKTYVAHVATNCGNFDITLDAANAPKTANNFVFLANNHYYDGLGFDRLAKDVLIQGGSPNGDTTGGPGYTLPDEPPKNGYKPGSVAMAKSAAGTSGAQFFIVESDQWAKTVGKAPYQYSSVGTVTKGYDTVQTLNQLAGPSDGPPQRPITIDSITISES